MKVETITLTGDVDAREDLPGDFYVTFARKSNSPFGESEKTEFKMSADVAFALQRAIRACVYKRLKYTNPKLSDQTISELLDHGVDHP